MTNETITKQGEVVMRKSSMKYSLVIGLFGFVVAFIVTLLLQSPQPVWASFVIAFLLFEISYFFFFHQEKRKYKL